MSAYWKIPLQALVLLVGIFTFLFYLFHQPPMLFNPVHDAQVRASAEGPAYVALERSSATRSKPDDGPPKRCAGARHTGDADASTVRRRTSGREDAARQSVQKPGDRAGASE